MHCIVSRGFERKQLNFSFLTQALALARIGHFQNLEELNFQSRQRVLRHRVINLDRDSNDFILVEHVLMEGSKEPSSSSFGPTAAFDVFCCFKSNVLFHFKRWLHYDYLTFGSCLRIILEGQCSFQGVLNSDSGPHVMGSISEVH